MRRCSRTATAEDFGGDPERRRPRVVTPVDGSVRDEPTDLRRRLDPRHVETPCGACSRRTIPCCASLTVRADRGRRMARWPMTTSRSALDRARARTSSTRGPVERPRRRAPRDRRRPGSDRGSAGVDARQLEVPYSPDLDFDGSLASCARPVLDDLAEQPLRQRRSAVVLTDADGHVLERRVGEGELQRRLDEISLGPGLQLRRGVRRHQRGRHALQGATPGARHRRRALHRPAAGLRVRRRPDARHPLSHGWSGILDVTCLRADANDLMRFLAQQAAHDIEQMSCASAAPPRRAGDGRVRATPAARPRPGAGGHRGLRRGQPRRPRAVRPGDQDRVRAPRRRTGARAGQDTRCCSPAAPRAC